MKSEVYESYEQCTDLLVCTAHSKKSTITTPNKKKKQTQLINAKSKYHLPFKICYVISYSKNYIKYCDTSNAHLFYASY